MSIAAQNGHLDIVCYLIEAGAHKDQATNDVVTPMLTAAHPGHLDIVLRYLIEAGA